MGGFLARLTNGAKDAESASAIEARAVDRAALLESLEESNLGWFWASDEAGQMVHLSQPAAERIGRSLDELTGTGLTDLFRQLDLGEGGSHDRPLNFQITKRNPFGPLTVRLETGARHFWWEIAGVPRFGADGAFCGYHGIAHDVSEAFQSKLDAEKRSRHDPLTGLCNRLHMSRQLETHLKAAKAGKRSCAVLLVDLDRFKQVNDTMGHPAGDEVLKQVAERLGRVFGPDAEIGRIGGDEFEIIMPDIDDRGTLGGLAEQAIHLISQPYSTEGRRAVIGCSIGVAIAPFDGIDASELVKACDLALYAAKDGGRGQYRFYSSQLRDQASYRHQIESDLRDAIARGELEVHYQPIVEAKTHKVACVEALMRWNHTERGAISPADFIPVAEDVGLIRELGEWALREVCATIQTWPGTVKAAVNVSAVQFASEGFVDTVRHALKATGVDPARIVLEITESVFVGETDQALHTFERLKGLGVQLSLDDFGTGYSSLSYLRDAPFDKIKIDQSFVRGCSAKNSRNDAIVESVVSLARALGMDTVAEGIENRGDLAVVTERGATHLQGMLFSRAITSAEMLERLEAGELVFEPRGPEKHRYDRRTEFRKIGLIHGDDRYNVFLRNLSKTGARIEGLLDVPIGTDVVLDLGGGQLAVATVRRSEGYSQGVEFETQLISDGADGLCTRHRVSPYQIEAAGRPLGALNDDDVAHLTGGGRRSAARAFVEVQIGNPNRA